MQKTILRIIWPYVLRYLAERSTDYLDQRRERKRQHGQAIHNPAENATAPQEVEFVPSVSPGRLSTTNAVWYTLSGVLLGSAIGLMLAAMFREEG